MRNLRPPDTGHRTSRWTSQVFKHTCQTRGYRTPDKSPKMTGGAVQIFHTPDTGHRTSRWRSQVFKHTYQTRGYRTPDKSPKRTGGAVQIFHTPDTGQRRLSRPQTRCERCRAKTHQTHGYRTPDIGKRRLSRHRHRTSLSRRVYRQKECR